MNANFNSQFAALLTDSGMNEHIAPLQANLMGQLLAQNPGTTAILLQAIADKNMECAKDILAELFATSTEWIENYFTENAAEIAAELAA